MNRTRPYAKINTSIIKSYDDVCKMADRELLDRAISFDDNSGLANSWIQNEILHRMSFYKRNPDLFETQKTSVNH